MGTSPNLYLQFSLPILTRTQTRTLTIAKWLPQIPQRPLISQRNTRLSFMTSLVVFQPRSRSLIPLSRDPEMFLFDCRTQGFAILIWALWRTAGVACHIQLRQGKLVAMKGLESFTSLVQDLRTEPMEKSTEVFQEMSEGK